MELSLKPYIHEHLLMETILDQENPLGYGSVANVCNTFKRAVPSVKSKL